VPQPQLPGLAPKPVEVLLDVGAAAACAESPAATEVTALEPAAEVPCTAAWAAHPAPAKAMDSLASSPAKLAKPVAHQRCQVPPLRPSL